MVKSDALEITFAMTVEISTTTTSSSNTTTTMQYRPAVVVGIVVEKFVVVAKISVVASTFWLRASRKQTDKTITSRRKLETRQKQVLLRRHFGRYDVGGGI